MLAILALVYFHVVFRKNTVYETTHFANTAVYYDIAMCYMLKEIVYITNGCSAIFEANEKIATGVGELPW